mmetsp:Transcript_49615/g.105591  ORF Transcript_49615/g.105591 Transcript_49615/m.105591 type:complete len:567 (-) Transcript_49615:107-1807(-)|eukprot:CAMPEP_0206450264 /NCGR_PEP_ID=MMETSP0324_2-20121206/18616_1 /ASSEMBLY_ACC=CAM_ASM_000836 /TAXON_ID=2866 /ORGANISM="Crypthecodinium cohnii, Strain Seligo" /LENGTH=566 /DNA_ID=CAMNT_0053919869 /DNA_START=130 /DNA_END=1830 /DNA_ORIENTATION=-
MPDSSNRICVVGACFTDLVTFSSRMPNPGETLPGSKFITGFGGKGANQAVQAARLGANVMMISKVGGDTFGADTLKNFKEQGIDAKHVQVVEGESSGVAPIFVNETTGQNSILIIPGALDKLNAGDIELARNDIRGSKLMICQLECPLEATMAALKVAKEEGVTTLLNTAPAKPLPDEIWAFCDIVCPNEPELQMLSGKPTSTDEEVKAAAEVLLHRGAKKLIVTLGERGCALFETGKDPLFVATKMVKAKDTTGAGDSFLGAFAASIAKDGSSLEAAMSKGNAVAAVSVTRIGTQLSFPDAREFLCRQAIGLIDHTSLGLDDTDDGIRALVDAAVAEEPHTAAVCIYPKFVKFVRSLQKDQPEKYPRSLKVCTVVNFPTGQEAPEKVIADTEAAVKDGADEVDLVIDYNLLKKDLAKGKAAAESLVKAVRAACTGDVILKVIIESGELQTDELIKAASEVAIAGGCDFVKTSTGKVKVNATLEAAKVMITCCKEAKSNGKTIGFKAAGGVRDAEQARSFLELGAEILFGDKLRLHEIDSRLFRFGASSLLPNLRKKEASAAGAGY